MKKRLFIFASMIACIIGFFIFSEKSQNTTITELKTTFALIYAKRVLSDPSQLKPTSRILKFKLDEQNKKILDIQEINLNVKTNSLGSVYQTKDLSLLVSTGRDKRILEIGTDNQILFELLLSLPNR